MQKFRHLTFAAAIAALTGPGAMLAARANPVAMADGASPAEPAQVTFAPETAASQPGAMPALSCVTDTDSTGRSLLITAAEGQPPKAESATEVESDSDWIEPDWMIDEPDIAGPAWPDATTLTLNLRASASTVKSGERFSLSWNGEGLSDCQASGAWTGSRPNSGTEFRTAQTARESYTLACNSAAGQIVAMTSVEVILDGTRISWSPPAQNIDGTPLAGLFAYRIYVGSKSQQYDQHIELLDTDSTHCYVDLQPGEYYIAMSAVDLNGNESALSNEVRKVVQ
jgi:hypothetical protein